MPPCPSFTRTFYVSGVPLLDLYARAFYSAPARPSPHTTPPPHDTPQNACILWYVRAPRRIHTATLATEHPVTLSGSYAVRLTREVQFRPCDSRVSADCGFFLRKSSLLRTKTTVPYKVYQQRTLLNTELHSINVTGFIFTAVELLGWLQIVVSLSNTRLPQGCPVPTISLTQSVST